MSANTDIVQYEEKTVLQLFSSEDGLKPIIGEVEKVVRSFEHDLSTATGRKKTASLAAKVSSFKVKIDGMGKDLVADWKTKAKAVDVNRKELRDTLDELRDEARKPLTEWEAEQERIEAEEQAKREAEALAAKIEDDHEMALLMNREFDRVREEEAKEAERIRLEQEAEAKRHQEEREKRIAEEAKAQAEREKIAAEEREKAAIVAKENAEREAAEAAKRAEIAAAEAKVRAEEQAKAAAEAARQEQIQLREMEERADREAQEARERNKEHIGSIRKQAKECLMKIAGIDEDLAKTIVLAISNDKIKNVSINY